MEKQQVSQRDSDQEAGLTKGVGDRVRGKGGGQGQEPEWSEVRLCESLSGLCFCSGQMKSQCRVWSGGVLNDINSCSIGQRLEGDGVGRQRGAIAVILVQDNGSLECSLTSRLLFHDEPQLTQRVVLKSQGQGIL